HRLHSPNSSDPTASTTMLTATAIRSWRRSVGRWTKRGTFGGSGCSRSTLSNTIFVPYSGISPSSVDVDRAIKATASVPRWPLSMPQKAESSRRNGRERGLRFLPSSGTEECQLLASAPYPFSLRRSFSLERYSTYLRRLERRGRGIEQ